VQTGLVYSGHRGIQLGISTVVICFWSPVDLNVRLDPCAFIAEPVPAQIRTHGQHEDVVRPELKPFSGEQAARGLRTDDGSQAVLPDEAGDHLSCSGGVLVY